MFNMKCSADVKHADLFPVPTYIKSPLPLKLELQRRHNLHLSLIYPALNHRLNIEVKLRSLFGLHVS